MVAFFQKFFNLFKKKNNPVKSPPIMRNFILRSKMLPDRCEGQLFDVATGKYLTDVLEPPYLNNQHDISSTPPGHYLYIPHDGLHWQDVWEAQYVEDGRTGVLWHPANWPRQLKGCHAPGFGFGDVVNPEGKLEYGIKNSGKALEFLKEYVGRDEKGKLLPFLLEIVRF